MVVMTMTLTIIGVSANAITPTGPIQENKQQSLIELMITAKEDRLAQLRAQKMQTRIEALRPYVDKTWYVFSGLTPDGWDCSGLVMWYYAEFGVELQHSVTAQMHSGEIVDEPLAGDLVSFRHNGVEMGYHNGIYIGNDMYIHSPREGKQTTLSSVSKYAGEHSVVVYTRINIGVLE